MHYYKQINAEGELMALLTCDRHLASNEFQVEITETEHAELYATLPQPEEPEFDDPEEIIDILTGEVE